MKTIFSAIEARHSDTQQTICCVSEGERLFGTFEESNDGQTPTRRSH